MTRAPPLTCIRSAGPRISSGAWPCLFTNTRMTHLQGCLVPYRRRVHGRRRPQVLLDDVPDLVNRERSPQGLCPVGRRRKLFLVALFEQLGNRLERPKAAPERLRNLDLV